jgi:hypothetical protein
MIAEEAKKSRMSRMGNMNSGNKKQRQTEEQIFGIGTQVSIQDI